MTTHLPSSEEAFSEGREETSPTITDVFNGATYSTFASAVITCHNFNLILKHIHNQKRDDRPEDFEHGEFWNRHRRLDTNLSSAFMFLPEKYRLPKNIRNPVAVQTNLNLHAAVISLHNEACEQADKHGLPAHVKQASEDRRAMAAQEIVNVMKLTAHLNTEYVRAPLPPPPPPPSGTATKPADNKNRKAPWSRYRCTVPPPSASSRRSRPKSPGT